MLNYNDEACVPILEKALISVYDCNPEEAASIIIPAWFKFVLKKKELQIAKLGSTAFDIPYNLSYLPSGKRHTCTYASRLCDVLTTRWRYIGLADSQPSQKRYALL